MFLWGQGGDKNELRAYNYFILAGENGLGFSYYNAGAMCLNGVGVERNLGKGMTYLERAQRLGYPEPEETLEAILREEIDHESVAAVDSAVARLLWSGETSGGWRRPPTTEGWRLAPPWRYNCSTARRPPSYGASPAPDSGRHSGTVPTDAPASPPGWPYTSLETDAPPGRGSG